MFTFSAVVVLPSDCILSFLFPTETDVLVPVLSRSTEVVVVNFVLVLKGAVSHALRISIACKNIRFSTLLAAGDVTRGGIGNRELKNHDEVHDDDVC